jgi:hypothetical protein
LYHFELSLAKHEVPVRPCSFQALLMSVFLILAIVMGLGSFVLSHLEPLHPPYFVMVFFFEIESHALFAQAGFEL